MPARRLALTVPSFADEMRKRLEAFLPAEASLVNPIDMIGSATAASYEAALPVVLEDPGIDAVIVLFVPAVSATADEVAASLVRTGVRDKPVLAVVMSAEGIPISAGRRDPGCRCVRLPRVRSPRPGPSRRARRLVAPPARATFPSWMPTEPAGAAVIDRALADGRDAWLEPADTRALLLAYGISLVSEAVAHSADEAIEAAAALGHPVVVKTATAGAHKTESGGIALDLADANAVHAAVTRIGPPVIIEPMIEEGTSCWPVSSRILSLAR